MKTRKIILHKDQLLYDIEGLAYKFSEATALEGKAKNVVAADHNETLDGRMLARMMDSRHARLCKRLRFALKAHGQEVACDNPGTNSEYIYELVLADGFDDNMLEVVKTHMHDYMTLGALYDWYRRLSIQTAAVDAGELQELEEFIMSILRTPSYIKAPMQPWGPKNPI